MESNVTIGTASSMTRRRLLGGAAALGLAGLPTGKVRSQLAAPAIVGGSRPTMPSGVQVGDLSGDRAIVWSRADRPARMLVTWATTEGMAEPTAAPPVHALEDTGLTAKVDLTGLPAGQRVWVPAQVKGQPWMLVSENGVAQGYVSAPLLVKATTAASDCKLVTQSVSVPGEAEQSETYQACKGTDGAWTMTKV